MEHGKLFYQNGLVIPKTSAYITKLLQEYHDSVMGGHSGDLKSYHRLAREWYWMGMGMRKDV